MVYLEEAGADIEKKPDPVSDYGYRIRLISETITACGISA